MKCRCVYSDCDWFDVGCIYDYDAKGGVDLYQHVVYTRGYKGETILYGFYSYEFDKWFIDISVERDRKIDEILRQDCGGV